MGKVKTHYVTHGPRFTRAHNATPEGWYYRAQSPAGHLGKYAKYSDGYGVAHGPFASKDEAEKAGQQASREEN